MRSAVFVFLFSLFMLASPFSGKVFAADKTAQSPTTDKASYSAETNVGGLICFSIQPAPFDPKTAKSCKDLCRNKGANCTGVSSPLSPPPSCEDSSQNLICRCCKVQ